MSAGANNGTPAMAMATSMRGSAAATRNVVQLPNECPEQPMRVSSMAPANGEPGVASAPSRVSMAASTSPGRSCAERSRLSVLAAQSARRLWGWLGATTT